MGDRLHSIATYATDVPRSPSLSRGAFLSWPQPT